VTFTTDKDHDHDHDHDHDDHDHDDHDHDDHDHDWDEAHEGTAAYACKCVVSTSRSLSREEYHSLAKELMGAIADGCWEQGAQVIGHIKAYMESGDAFFYASTVGNPDDMTVKDKGGETSDKFQLTINSIIFGIEETKVKLATDKAVEAVISKNGFSLTR
jgi:hypothetical protein